MTRLSSDLQVKYPTKKYERNHLRESCDVSSPLEELRLVLKGSRYFDGACNELESMGNICCHKINADLLVSR